MLMCSGIKAAPEGNLFYLLHHVNYLHLEIKTFSDPLDLFLSGLIKSVLAKNKTSEVNEAMITFNMMSNN